MNTENKRLLFTLGVIAFLLFIPLIAMQITGEVNWTLFDFFVVGILLIGAGLIFEVLMRLLKETKHKVFAGAIILAGFLIVWAELAVGIFGTPFAGN